MKMTEEQQEKLVFEYPKVYEEELDETRWTMIMETVVKVDDKFYRVCWQRGLTELQENSFEDGDVPEVFPVINTLIREETTYLTHHEIKQSSPDSLSSRLMNDSESLKITSSVDTQDILQTYSEDIKKALELVNELSILNDSDAVRSHNNAAREYFSELLKVEENNG